MRHFHTILTVLLALGSIVILVLWQNSRRELELRLHTVTSANDSLRESLGELTREITKKEREIDQLQTPCRPNEQTSRNRL
jgi:hypothetical protein